MRNSQVLAEHLARAGVTTFFGVQGGGSAHLIEAMCQNDKTTFIPSLNEQAAGLSAHGYFFSTGKPAGGISTCGPGFFNLITGIAACYYDNIPSVFLVGQVGSGLNVASKFGTKMYGFQEAPHAEIAAFLAEKSLKVRNDEEFLIALKAINEINPAKSTGPLVIELQDDFQRMDSLYEDLSFEDKPSVTVDDAASQAADQIIEALKNSAKPLLMIGSGVSRASDTALDDVDNLPKVMKIPTVFSWGGQRLFDRFNDYHIGLYGGHSPGIGNSLVQQSDLVIGFGVSLLQHQAGKEKDKFAPNAKLIIINNEPSEIKRYDHDFGERLTVLPADCADVLRCLTTRLAASDWEHASWDDLPSTNTAKDWACLANPEIINELRDHQPVKTLRIFLEECPKNFCTFSDAGATLSWTYQAATQCDAPQVTTSFNLHTMGYSLPAAVGAAAASSSPGAFAISGDGGFMMNIQELAVARNLSAPVKILVLDNRGYGIIRQTQNAFLGGRHFGSDMGEFPSLPEFNIVRLTEAFGFETLVAAPEEADAAAKWLFEKNSNHRAVVISIDPEDFVKHTMPMGASLVY